jgi:hypothetical protein
MKPVEATAAVGPKGEGIPGDIPDAKADGTAAVATTVDGVGKSCVVDRIEVRPSSGARQSACICAHQR